MRYLKAYLIESCFLGFLIVHIYFVINANLRENVKIIHVYVKPTYRMNAFINLVKSDTTKNRAISMRL